MEPHLRDALMLAEDGTIFAQPDAILQAFHITAGREEEVNLLPFLHRSGAEIVEVGFGESVRDRAAARPVAAAPGIPYCNACGQEDRRSSFR